VVWCKTPQGFRSNEELKKVFETFGAVTDAHIPVNRATGVAKGFAFVEFKRSNHADACAPGPRCRALGRTCPQLSPVQALRKQHCLVTVTLC
jgi:hypothetical protein